MSYKVVTVNLNPALDKTVKIDKFNFGKLNRVNEISVDAGGKGINVAKVLNNFDVETLATGLIAGNQGKVLLELAKKQDINLNFIEVEGETRTNLKLIDNSLKITTEINETGFTVRNSDLSKYKELLKEILKEVKFIVLSGSIPKGCNTSIYKEIIKLAKEMNVKSILDADGETFKEGLNDIPNIIKPNIHELSEYYGREINTDKEIVSISEMLIANGIEIVLVSMGKDGAVIVDKEKKIRVHSYDIDPVSPVAAGDSMVATILYAYLNNYSLEDMAKLTTAAGTITTTKKGSQVCSKEEAFKVLDKVKIEYM
jgi:1-phosphofructokinase